MGSRHYLFFFAKFSKHIKFLISR